MTVTIKVGDCIESLRTLEPDSVDCVVTSPPYWGLRDYGVLGQIGMEPTLGEHIAVLIEVFREVRRVLKKSGTVWLNYGDCYASSPNGRSAADTKLAGKDDRTFRDKPISTVGPIYVADPRDDDRRGNNSTLEGAKPHHTPGRIVAGGYLKPKDLCMIPNRLAIALQDDGWWVRSEIIWHKPNPMPESIKDRPGCSHEKIFLLAKSDRYFYDADAVAERAGNPDWDDGTRVFGGVNKHGANVRNPQTTGRLATRAKDTQHGAFPPGSRPHNLSRFEMESGRRYARRNLRNVWTIPTAAFSEAHFATFPPALVEPCIKAGCPEGGLVLDPFGGAGTVGLVAENLGRNSVLMELNPEYAEIARNRILLARQCEVAGMSPPKIDGLPLFSAGKDAAE